MGFTVLSETVQLFLSLVEMNVLTHHAMRLTGIAKKTQKALRVLPSLSQLNRLLTG